MEETMYITKKFKMVFFRVNFMSERLFPVIFTVSAGGRFAVNTGTTQLNHP